ncbi:hypothetical protein NEOC95_001833 [Neochlamydia sp. AcF95]|nr:hypothetical protein [Neochlamydia sp. AcF95]
MLGKIKAGGLEMGNDPALIHPVLQIKNMGKLPFIPRINRNDNFGH